MLEGKNNEMAAMLEGKNNETAAMLEGKTNPVGVELFSYIKTFFCYNKFAWLLVTWVKTVYSKLPLKPVESGLSIFRFV